MLKRAGHEIAASEVTRTAARIEAGLGGSELASLRDGEPLSAPASLPGAQVKAVLGHLRPRRRRRMSVAISGVDGAGKSTLIGLLRRDLETAGVPAAVVWTRPGLDLELLERVARIAKRALGQKPSPGIRDVARGDTHTVRSRRGAVGWSWALLVTIAFLRRARRQFRRSRGVVLYDRHLADALATLEFAYPGVNLRLQRALIRRLLPPADLTLYLDIDLESAIARKPGDVIGRHAVTRQLEVYRSLLPELSGALVLDAGRAPADLAADAFERIAAG